MYHTVHANKQTGTSLKLCWLHVDFISWNIILHPILVTCSQDCCPNTSFILFRNTLGNHKLTFYGILAGTTLFYSACYYTIGSLHCFIFKNCLGEQQNNFNLEGVIYLYHKLSSKPYESHRNNRKPYESHWNITNRQCDEYFMVFSEKKLQVFSEAKILMIGTGRVAFFLGKDLHDCFSDCTWRVI